MDLLWVPTVASQPELSQPYTSRLRIYCNRRPSPCSCSCSNSRRCRRRNWRTWGPARSHALACRPAASRSYVGRTRGGRDRWSPWSRWCLGNEREVGLMKWDGLGSICSSQLIATLTVSNTSNRGVLRTQKLFERRGSLVSEALWSQKPFKLRSPSNSKTH